jgi:apolipoprotein N-acyltransferase
MRTPTGAFTRLAGIRPPTGAVALSALSGALYALCFPPWSLAPLAWVALVPFFVAVAQLRPPQAAVCGVVWTFVAAYGVGWWFPAMIAAYFEVSLLVGWLGFVAVTGTLAAGYFAALAAWISWLTRRRAAHPLLVAAGWGACEFVRARLLFGNPWALLGYSQAGVAPLMQLADLAGVYGIGMLIAAVNACVAGFLAPRLRPRRPVIAWGAVATACIAAGLYGSWRLGEGFTSGAPVNVAIVQAGVDHAFRMRPGGREAALARYLAMTDEVASGAPDLVVWPESALDFYLQEPSAESEAVRAVTRRTRADFLVGGPAYGFVDDTFRYTNSVFLLHAGAITGRYDKLRPLPVAEEGLFTRLVRRPLSYERGDGLRAFRTRAGMVGPFVCSDGLYPDLVRSLATRGSVELLVDLSNDAWFAHGGIPRGRKSPVLGTGGGDRLFGDRRSARQDRGGE